MRAVHTVCIHTDWKLLLHWTGSEAHFLEGLMTGTALVVSDGYLPTGSWGMYMDYRRKHVHQPNNGILDYP